MQEKRFNPYPALFIAALLLASAYGAVYLATAKLEGLPRFDAASEQSGYDPFYAENPRVNSILGRFFIPAHEIDRLLRPGFWHIDRSPVNKHAANGS